MESRGVLPTTRRRGPGVGPESRSGRGPGPPGTPGKGCCPRRRPPVPPETGGRPVTWPGCGCWRGLDGSDVRPGVSLGAGSACPVLGRARCLGRTGRCPGWTGPRPGRRRLCPRTAGRSRPGAGVSGSAGSGPRAAYGSDSPGSVKPMPGRGCRAGPGQGRRPAGSGPRTVRRARVRARDAFGRTGTVPATGGTWAAPGPEWPAATLGGPRRPAAACGGLRRPRAVGGVVRGGPASCHRRSRGPGAAAVIRSRGGGRTMRGAPSSRPEQAGPAPSEAGRAQVSGDRAGAVAYRRDQFGP